MVDQPIEVSDFGGNVSFMLGYTNIDLIVAPTKYPLTSRSLMLANLITCYSEGLGSVNTNPCLLLTVRTPFAKAKKCILTHLKPFSEGRSILFSLSSSWRMEK